MKRILIVAISILMSYGVYAQGGKIKFTTDNHDFGTIREEIELAVAKFEFTNVGTGDLQVTHVQASCGCTATDYTSTIVKPGEKGYVTATYHTANRPGEFRKSITVTVNDVENPTIVLFIKGSVIPRAKSKGELYPMAMGNVKFMNNHLNFNEIKNTEKRSDSIKIYNAWEQPLNISFQNIPPHVMVKASPATLKFDEEGYLVFTYDATKKADFGSVSDLITIITNDPAQPQKTMTVSANIIEDFSKMSAKALSKAPVITFDESNFNFGKVKSTTVIKHEFTFTNTGKSTLIIRKVKTDCGCTTAEMPKMQFKKGEKGTITVEFDTKGRNGMDNKVINLITNDPKRPIIQLYLTGEVF